MFVSIPLFEHKRLSFSEISQKDISDRFLYDNDFVSNIERFLERNALEDTQPYTDEEIEVALQC